MMNFFRMMGDASHVLSFLFLGHVLFTKRSIRGISRKTQVLYLIVFLCRYLDLFTSFHSLYNTGMKILFISFTGVIVYLMHFPVRATDRFNFLGITLDLPATYDPSADSFIMPVALGPAVALALLFNEFKGSIFRNPTHWLLEVLWATSIYLESVAILPQQIMLRRLGIVENITANYVASLGAYRFFYILNWVYRYYTELHYSAWIPWVSGFIQTALYADFFWCYVKSKAKGHKNVDVGILPN